MSGVRSFTYLRVKHVAYHEGERNWCDRLHTRIRLHHGQYDSVGLRDIQLLYQISCGYSVGIVVYAGAGENYKGHITGHQILSKFAQGMPQQLVYQLVRHPSCHSSLCLAGFHTRFVTPFVISLMANSPPEFAEGLAELGVVQLRVLIGQFSPRRLRPYHEGVHWPLHVQLPLVRRCPGENTVQQSHHQLLKAVHDKRRNEWVRRNGDPRENPPTSDIVQYDSYVRKSGSDPTGNRLGGRRGFLKSLQANAEIVAPVASFPGPECVLFLCCGRQESATSRACVKGRVAYHEGERNWRAESACTWDHINSRYVVVANGYGLCDSSIASKTIHYLALGDHLIRRSEAKPLAGSCPAHRPAVLRSYSSSAHVPNIDLPQRNTTVNLTWSTVMNAKAVQCWDTEIVCAQPARSVCRILDLWAQPERSVFRIVGLWAQPTISVCRIFGLWAQPARSVCRIFGIWAQPARSVCRIFGLWAQPTISVCRIVGLWEQPARSVCLIFGLWAQPARSVCRILDLWAQPERSVCRIVGLWAQPARSVCLIFGLWAQPARSVCLIFGLWARSSRNPRRRHIRSAPGRVLPAAPCGPATASQKRFSDTHNTPYDRVKRCRERKINIKASERVNSRSGVAVLLMCACLCSNWLPEALGSGRVSDDWCGTFCTGWVADGE
ncbi:hypothetical protein PR048_003163 [Dryococelus australis]|uniref:Uncharacterized protein n=1 Tax=Dryococelus australis TaxID=614101 RepID=A0ABQ9IM84_9NEOP|nr:hypothetical protein PR048_003163 [Dryococelus australis]